MGQLCLVVVCADWASWAAGLTPAQGALPLLYAAAAPDVEGGLHCTRLSIVFTLLSAPRLLPGAGSAVLSSVNREAS